MCSPALIGVVWKAVEHVVELRVQGFTFADELSQ
jgi:hypothetical protein